MSEPQVVCVFGMHRSGTSLTTALLRLLGVFLGPPDRMMTVQPDNPQGFYEHRLFNDIDDEILARLGGSWSEPPAFAAGWETAAAFGDLRQRARAVIQQDFGSASIWGWKNPRACLTLPFWQRLLPSLKYVICLRNPIDVARSLQHRNGLSIAKGVDLWLTHVASALIHTSGQPRLFIFYEDVMDNVHRELQRLAIFLQRYTLGESAEIRDAARGLVEYESQHQSSSVIDAVDEPMLTFPARALYLVLRTYVSRSSDQREADGRVDAILQEALDHFGQYSADVQLDDATQRRRVAEQEKAELRAKLGRVQTELDVALQSKSWRLTQPFRDLASSHLASSLRRLQRKVGRGVDEARDLWFRTAWERVPFNSRHEAPTGPHRVSYRVTIPASAWFRSIVTIPADGRAASDGCLEMSVSVVSASSGRAVERTWRIPSAARDGRRRAECRLDLSQFANQEVEFAFSASLRPASTAGLPLTVWGDPAILSRKPAREVWALYAGYARLHGLRGSLNRRRLRTASRVTVQPPSVPHQRAEAGALVAPEVSVASARSLMERTWKDKLKLLLAQPSARLVFPAHQEPLVSIVIPTFNKAEYLYQCLESILAYTEVPYEVIVVDDCSQDATTELLMRLDNVTSVRNESNLEFIRTSNRGARMAKGRYLMFLNNDVTVTPRWLSTLAATMEQYPGCGAVQGKLIRPDGTLQEAGTIIWRDGSALGYGRGDDPLRPEYSYVREVDHCSAACLLVRAELFHELGGFDERYVPAYYEDVDLCFGIRRLGHKVVVQPQVSVFHHEFGSRSFDRAEALCRANQPKFARKWAAELAAQCDHGEVLRARDRREGPRVLVMDDQIPVPHLGSGSSRVFTMLELLCQSGYVSTFVPLRIPTQHQPATRRLEQLGIEVFSGDGFLPEDLLRERAGYYDIVVISRPHNGVKYLNSARQYFPNARIVYDAEAVFCVREFLRADLEGRGLSEAEKRGMLRQELDIVKSADVVITVSDQERDLIVRETGHDQVVVWGHALDVRPPVTPFSERRDLLFVGGFLQGHPPNTDAVMHFAHDLFPAIRQRLPDCRFVIVGAEPPESVRRLASPHIVVAGYVDALEEYYERCRVFVVPLRFGAGISLKLVEAMSQGIPAVATTMGAIGLDLKHGREALIAGDDREFVDNVVRLYEDGTLWSEVQRAAQDHVQRRYAPDVMRQRLAEALGTARGARAR